ncbi:MAG TPA: CAP domain-containing protein [Candidatus Saccharimonadales bacterium]|nr:CAP domain-containing protein [Candidatus Saccharimonadales bacterium]
MTKQKSKTGKYPPRRRTTFKKHSKRYTKVYSPYLPIAIGLAIGLAVIIGNRLNTGNNSVLGYASSTSPQTLLEQTNEKRESAHTQDLKINKALEYAAQLKANDMAKRDYWSHITPDGKQPWYFIDKAGYGYSQAAENLAYGFTSSENTIDGWMNSTEHRESMLNKDYADVGFGIANSPDYQNHGPETIVVALYGKPDKPNAPGVRADFIDKSPGSISRLQTLTGGKWPWINLISGMMIGIIAMYLVTKHSLKLRRRLRAGEDYILHHPALDMTLLTVLILLLVLSRTVGFIH